MTFAFSFEAQPGANTKFVDLSQAASILNRRFYRQGVNWAVAGMKILNVDGMQGAFQCSKLPTTWVISNSWTKSFKVWQTMIRNAVDEPGMESIKGKFLDFKIFADSTHHEAGFGANLLPLDSTATQGVPGQWQSSVFVIPAAGTGIVSDRDIIAVGANLPGTSPATGNNAVSMVQGYADSRALPYEQDPNVPVDASLNWMLALFNEGTLQDNAVVNDLETLGDRAPYPFEGDGSNVDTMYPGGETQLASLEFHDIEYFTPTTISNTVRLKGGNFPCGLMRFDCVNDEDNARTVTIVIDMIPGHHRGYLCETMNEM